ncbi:hypothetical protein NDU88_010073 [Pleurodeles waltl]|uniref:Uncharacterized protein n=1 Tax=Pleurodeles waltl TaxID=8319 RepID=A0AAV7PXN0_PLEWA|nr:hypothetical protein NDU88_010073 [Pleurodeles waltl]
MGCCGDRGLAQQSASWERGVVAEAYPCDRSWSYFFEQSEEVWRWLEMWDKAALGRPTGARGVVNRTSGADGSDWWNHEGERTTDFKDQGVVDVPGPRVEIQQDGTMAVVPDE